ncbi:MAG: oligosaccharide flippase family protein [Flavobacteriales bacterium]|nr:oligosaccharide flippase family protein [Flavobacteriales bacterium]
MNAVSRQGIKYGIVGYFSFIVGTLSSIFIYPYDYEFYGTLRYILSVSELFFPFILIGISHSNVKFFSEMKEKNTTSHLLSFSFLFSFLICILWIIIVEFSSLFFDGIKNLEFWNYRFYIYALALILALNQIISKYTTNLKRIVIPGLLEKILPKLGMLSAFLLFVFFNVDYEFSIWIFILFFGICFLGLYYYLKKLDSFKFSTNFNFLKENNFYKPLFNFGFYSLLGALGSILALRIDGLMIVELIDKEANGIYSILLSLITLISIPAMGIYSISTPIIREYLLNNEVKKLDSLYKKTSFFLFLIGVFLFCLLISGMDSLFLLMKNGNELLPYLSVVYVLGFATLFDLATSFNSYVISMSSFYKYNVYFMLILSILNIYLNYIFVVTLNLGIFGIGLATALSLTLYNIIKIIFNWKKFSIQPFTRPFVSVILLGFSSLLILVFIPRFGNNYANLIIRPLLIILFFLAGNHVLKLIPLTYLSPKNWKNIITGK